MSANTSDISTNLTCELTPLNYTLPAEPLITVENCTLNDLKNNKIIDDDIILVLGDMIKNDGFSGLYKLLENDNLTLPIENYIVSDKLNRRWIYMHPLEEDELLDNIILNENYFRIIFPEAFGKIEKGKDCSEIINNAFKYAAFCNNTIVYLNNEYTIEHNLVIPKCNIKIVGNLLNPENNLNFSLFNNETRASSYDRVEFSNALFNLKDNFIFKNNSLIELDSDDNNIVVFVGALVKKDGYDYYNSHKKTDLTNLFIGNWNEIYFHNTLLIGYIL